MSVEAMIFVGFVVAMFSFVGLIIYYGQRQTELAAKARLMDEAKRCSDANCTNETGARLRSSQTAVA